jgi:hypothetical protein
MVVELPTLGWDPSFEAEWQRGSTPEQVPARIAAIRPGWPYRGERRDLRRGLRTARTRPLGPPPA